VRLRESDADGSDEAMAREVEHRPVERQGNSRRDGSGRPVVSVIVPSYNKPEYLPECLRSIQNQTFTEWECIVVSDGSPRVEEIRAAVASMNDPRFRLVEHERNRGPAAARNTGAKAARGDWLLCVDEDDAVAPECVEVLLSTALTRGVDLVHPQVRFHNGKLSGRRYVLPDPIQTLHSQPLLGVGFLIRRSTWEELGGYDESPDVDGREDTEWWIRVLHGGVHLLVIDDPLYIYRPPKEDSREASQNIRSMARERRIRQYIVRKHTTLYWGREWAQRRMLAKGYWWEGYWNWIHRRWCKGFLLMGMSIVISPTVHGLNSLAGIVMRTGKGLVVDWLGRASPRAEGFDGQGQG